MLSFAFRKLRLRRKLENQFELGQMQVAFEMTSVRLFGSGMYLCQQTPVAAMQDALASAQLQQDISRILQLCDLLSMPGLP